MPSAENELDMLDSAQKEVELPSQLLVSLCPIPLQQSGCQEMRQLSDTQVESLVQSEMHSVMQPEIESICNETANSVYRKSNEPNNEQFIDLSMLELENLRVSSELDSQNPSDLKANTQIQSESLYSNDLKASITSGTLDVQLVKADMTEVKCEAFADMETTDQKTDNLEGDEISVTYENENELDPYTNEFDDSAVDDPLLGAELESVMNLNDPMVIEDGDDIIVTHGLEYLRDMTHLRPVLEVFLNPKTKDYYTFDGESVQTFTNDGRLVATLTPMVSFNRLIYIEHMSKFVCWTAGTNKLMILNTNLAVNFNCAAPGPILATAYNKNIQELIVTGPGFVSFWMFRYGGRALLMRHLTVDGLSRTTDFFTLLAVEDANSSSQNLYAVNNRSVAMFNVLTGSLISYRKSLHAVNITAILLYNHLKYVITAASDGNIKIWDSEWRTQLVFTGHVGGVTSLSIYPYGMTFMSTGEDQTLRCWSLQTCDQIERLNVGMVVSNIVSSINNPTVAMLTSEGAVSLWIINRVYQLHTRIGFKTLHMLQEEGSRVCTLTCGDGSIRLISTDYGDVLTTLLMPNTRGLVSCAYSASEDTIFAAYTDGYIIKGDTCTNPCTVISDWPLIKSQPAAKCLLIYEYLTTNNKATAPFAPHSSAEQKSRSFLMKDLPGGSGCRYSDRSSFSRTLLFGGRANGSLCVYNWDTGKVDFVIEGHGGQEVVSMIVNCAEDQIISGGSDKSVHIWRVYPYARETLALLMTLQCAQIPVHLAVLGVRLVIGLQDPSCAAYCVVIHNLKTKDRYDHEPREDHNDIITALTSCPRLKISASSSLDGTVRVWNVKNKLLRVIRLGAVATSLCFCSDRGDLLIGIDDHVHRIDWTQYMPESYRLKMAAELIEPPFRRAPIPFSEELLSRLSELDMLRLKGATAAIKYTSSVKCLTADDDASLRREKIARQQAYNKLDAREKEIEALRDGLIHPTKLRTSTPATKTEAFEKYLRVFYDRQKPVSVDDITVNGSTEGPIKPFPPKYSQFRTLTPSGFFPPPNRTYPLRGDAPNADPTSASLRGWSSVSHLSGAIPNSVLIRLLFPEKPSAQIEQEKIDMFKLMHENLLKAALLNKEYNDDDDNSSTASSPRVRGGRGQTEAERMQAMIDRLANKSNNGVEVESDEEFADKNTGVSEQASPDGHPKSGMKSGASDASREHLGQKLIKPLAFKKIGSVEEGGKSMATQNDLPDYVTRFIRSPWLEKLFPNILKEAKSLSLSDWIAQLAAALRTADLPTRVHLLETLNQLHSSFTIANIDVVSAAIYGAFYDGNASSYYGNAQGRQFIQSGLKLLKNFGCTDEEFYVALMVAYIEGDSSIKKQVLEILKANGLTDSAGMFPKEMLSLNVSASSSDNKRQSELCARCKNWLEKWTALFTARVKDAIERLKKGQTVQAQVGSSSMSKSTKNRKQKQLNVNVDANTISEVSASCMEAINYFCETQLTKQMLRNARNGSNQADWQVDFPEGNAILSLPTQGGKGSLMRLGETHVSHRTCRSTADMKLPPLHHINLPLKKCSMNPFPRPEDDLDPLYGAESVLIMLRNVQKYYVPSRSYTEI